MHGSGIRGAWPFIRSRPRSSALDFFGEWEMLLLKPSPIPPSTNTTFITPQYWVSDFRPFSYVSFFDGVEEFKINWKRVAVTSMFGFGFVGPVGHFWYEGLDRFVRLRLQLQPKSLRFVGAKVATDALVFGPLDLVVFFTYMGLSSGKSVSQVKEDVKRDFIPAFILGGGVWPIVQVANFKFVPVRYQLLYVNIFCLLDSAFLSWLEQQQDAPWKKWFASFLGLEEKERQG